MPFQWAATNTPVSGSRYRALIPPAVTLLALTRIQLVPPLVVRQKPTCWLPNSQVAPSFRNQTLFSAPQPDPGGGLWMVQVAPPLVDSITPGSEVPGSQ